jgi:hypothetical protein
MQDANGRGFRVCACGDGDRRDVGEKSVAAPRDGFDEAGIFGGITERFANLVDRLVEPVIEIDHRAAPEPVAKLVARDDLSRSFEQHRKNLERLILQPDTQAPPGQLARPNVDFEYAESKAGGRFLGLLHAVDAAPLRGRRGRHRVDPKKVGHRSSTPVVAPARGRGWFRCPPGGGGSGANR